MTAAASKTRRRADERGTMPFGDTTITPDIARRAALATAARATGRDDLRLLLDALGLLEATQ